MNGQQYSEDEWSSLVDYSKECFPSRNGPNTEEIAKLEEELRRLVREGGEVESIREKSEVSYAEIEQLTDKSKQDQSEIAESTIKIRESVVEAQNDISKISQIRAESENALSEIKADRETILETRDSVKSIENSVQTVVNDLKVIRDDINGRIPAWEANVSGYEGRAEEIVSENEKLQERINEQLLKAVGISLFGAFEKRKRRIIISKWVWAGFMCAGLVVQFGLIIWLANFTSVLPEASSFYTQPTFFLRALASIPIILFIGYSIRQYAKERDFEELYGFKSVLSYSLAPYLDLVKELSEKPEQQEMQTFVKTTIGQIFENPMDKLDHSGGGAKLTDATDLVEAISKIVESAKK